ncbi:MAG: hypothetical protein FJW35_04975 [Acidobacteria bacterium]|nr:hypothetical protein [Acidobacteriota bacterium]
MISRVLGRGGHRPRKAVLALVAFAVWNGACPTARSPLEQAAGDSNWMERWQRKSGDGEFHRGMRVARRGTVRPSLVLAAPAQIALQWKGAAGRLRVRCWAAPVFNIGDGCLLSVTWVGDDRTLSAFSRYFDAARNEADREWSRLDFLVEMGGRPDGELVFELTGGPEGDLTADWMAFADLTVVPAGER